MNKGEKPKDRPPCLHQQAIYRVRTIPKSQLSDVKAGWMSFDKKTLKNGVILAATIEAPVMGSDGIVEKRTAEWLFGAIHLTKVSICLHLGADAFINASPVFRAGKFWFTRSDWDSKRETIPMGPMDFMVAPMIFRGILESEAVHISRNTSPTSESRFSKIEKRLRMIVDPKGYLEKDTCHMSTNAVAELKKQITVFSVMID